MAPAAMMHGTVQVLGDAHALARAAAERIVQRMSRVEEPVVVLTGGSTPEGLYRLLATEPWRSRVPWERARWFWGDERFVPPDDALSNGRMAMRALLDHVPVRPQRVHRIPTEVADPHQAAIRYEARLRAFRGNVPLDAGEPLFDLVLMGVGDDGHTASLFPGQPAVDERSRWVVGIDHAGLEPFVPRVTLTLPALASTREMLFLVSGAGKRPVLGRIQQGEQPPAARAWSRGDLVWLVDRAAMPAS